MHPDELGHHNAQHILHGDEQTGGQGDLHAQLAAGVFQQLGTEAIAHAHEEDILAQVLDGANVKRQGDDAGALDGGHQDREQQTGDHGGGDGELSQGGGVVDDEPPQEHDDGGKAQAGQIFKLKPGDGTIRCWRIGAEVA